MPAETIEPEPPPLPFSPAAVHGSVGNLQIYYDMLFPSTPLTLYEHEAYLVQLSTFDISLPRCTLVPGKNAFNFPQYDCLRPNLKTQMPPKKPNTQLETLLGFQKRNGNVARLHSGLNPEILAKRTYDHFIQSAVEPSSLKVFEQFHHSPIDISNQDFDEWLRTQDNPDVVRKLSQSDSPINERLTNLFNFMIKTAVKPAMQDSDYNKVASVQTIAAALKSVNALYCPIFIKLKRRWLSVMRSKYVYLTDLSLDEFEELLNRRFSSIEYLNSTRIENDISKYDKSMRAWTLLFETRIYKALGLPDHLALIWYQSHVLSRYLDSVSGFSTTVAYQRRSGDASTFFGNTLVNHAVAMAIYADYELLGGVFAGDDNHLWGLNTLRDNVAPIYSDIFNFEAKTLTHFHTSYFCGKFILASVDGFTIVPDPIKLLMKLGRRDLRNWDHVAQYQVSCKDNMKPLLNAFIYRQLSEAISERYNSSITEFSGLFHSINFVVSTQHEFSKLYYTLPDDRLLLDPSLPSLEV